MKNSKIELKVIVKEGINLNYRELLIACLEAPKQGRQGAAYSEMVVVVPILNKIRDAKEFVLLSKSEFSELKERVTSFPFRINNGGILEFIEDVINAPAVEVVTEVVPDIE